MASLSFPAAPGGFKLQMSSVPSSTLLPLHPEILASLFTPDGQPYLQEVRLLVLTGWAAESAGGVPPIHVPLVSVILLQVMFAMRELSGPLSLLIEMVTYSSYCNESFSLGVLQLLKVRGKRAVRQSWQTGVGDERSDLITVSVRPSWRRLHLMN